LSLHPNFFSTTFSPASHQANPAGPRKQIIGFAKFRTSAAALAAVDVLCGRRIDPDRNVFMKAELAKKNLHPKRGSICVQDYVVLPPGFYSQPNLFTLQHR